MNNIYKLNNYDVYFLEHTLIEWGNSRTEESIQKCNELESMLYQKRIKQNIKCKE